MIKKLQNGLRSKEFSCTEITKKYLDAIKNQNEDLIAYVNITEGMAINAAEMVDKKIASGEEISSLEGIPMTLKDNISTKDIETTCCSKILEGYNPIYSASVWDKLQKDGAVLLGKTNMDEFAMGSACETSCFGGAKNPHNKNHVAGGSSGGAASAVAAGLATYGLGSDTGGSIRQPASFCGAVGLKPTYGSVSRYGLIAYASSFDQIGPITMSCEDSALVFDAISFKDKMDSTCVGAPEKAESGLNDGVKGMRIGFAKEYFKGASDEVKQATQQAMKTYEKMGAVLTEISLPSVEYALPVYYILACAEASSNLGRYDGIRYGYRADSYNSIHEMICKTRSEGFGDEVQRRILLGTYVLSSGYYDAYYKKAQVLRGSIVEGFEKAFKECDMIIAPTVPMTAFESGFTSQDPIQTYQTDLCTVPVNIAGLPAISLPCGFDKKGLPIGMQLIGNKFTERSLLCAANSFEKETERKFMKETEGGAWL